MVFYCLGVMEREKCKKFTEALFELTRGDKKSGYEFTDWCVESLKCLH